MNQAWQDFLAQQGASADFEHFANPAAEIDVAKQATSASNAGNPASTTLFVPLTDSALIRATGEEAATFLHNLLTNDVSGLAADQARRAGFCTPKGRLLSSFLYWHENTGTGASTDLWLQVATDIQPALLKKLSMYILRSKAKLHDGADRVQIGLAGAAATMILTALGTTAPAALQTSAISGGQVIGLGDDRFILALDVEAAIAAWPVLSVHAQVAGLNAWRLLDIAAGVPRVVAATQELFIPQMVNFEAVGGVSFKKGCYPGQEIVARTQYLGKVKRRMYRADVSALAAAGNDLYAPETGDQSCGNVVLTAKTGDNRSECLVVLQSTTVEAGIVHLGAPDGPALTFLPLPYEN